VCNYIASSLGDLTRHIDYTFMPYSPSYYVTFLFMEVWLQKVNSSRKRLPRALHCPWQTRTEKIRRKISIFASAFLDLKGPKGYEISCISSRTVVIYDHSSRKEYLAIGHSDTCNIKEMMIKYSQRLFKLVIGAFPTLFSNLILPIKTLVVIRILRSYRSNTDKSVLLQNLN
jgi:hypothetical protein